MGITPDIPVIGARLNWQLDVLQVRVPVSLQATTPRCVDTIFSGGRGAMPGGLGSAFALLLPLRASLYMLWSILLDQSMPASSTHPSHRLTSPPTSQKSPLLLLLQAHFTSHALLGLAPSLRSVPCQRPPTTVAGSLHQPCLPPGLCTAQPS